MTNKYDLLNCDDIENPLYMFRNGIDLNVNVEEYYYKFERFCMIYISKQSGAISINNSVFTNNIGTFGGTIIINEPLKS